jgi:hypothetical protein
VRLSFKLQAVAIVALGALAALGSARAEKHPPEVVMAPAALKGEPKIKSGEAKAAFVWVDEKGVHVRWSSDGKPALFSGSLELDKPFARISRVNALAGGFVDGYGDRIVMFSATAREALDGFDLALPAGTSVKLDAMLDGAPLEVERLNFGEAQAHPKELPVKFACR